MSAFAPFNRPLSEGQDVIKPVQSLELSLVPSTDGNELAAVLSHEEEDFNHSMITACELVHSILDQITWNDAPPTNDGMSNAVKVREEKPAVQGYSRQCHITPAPLDSPKSLPRKDDINQEGSENPSDLWNACFKMHSNPSETKMGHVTLATLCARTLETVGQSSKPSKTLPDSDIIPASGLKASPKKGRASQNRNWLRRRKQSQKSGESPKFAEIVVSQQSPRNKHEQPKEMQKEQRDDNPSVMAQSDKENQSNRLQLFGSEYARYLSTTALAPKEAHQVRGPTLPRPNLNRRKAQNAVVNIEDTELSVLTGPITDLVMTVGDDPPPKGYYRISQSACGGKFILGDKKAPVYINIKKETNWDRAAQRPCVTALALIFPQRKEFVPPGFSVVRTHTSLPKSLERAPTNLNLGDEQIFLCFRRSREGNPITAIMPLIPSHREAIPEGFTVMEKTPRNHVAAIQTQTSVIFLAYRQRLANLEPLRPLPLVMSVRNASSNVRRLNAYFCTGGTIVESRVGRFHIMDRSTHTLLSPSSISNRLALIEASRRKALDSLNSSLPSDLGNTYAYSAGNVDGKPYHGSETLTSSLLLAHGVGLPSNRSTMSETDKSSSAGDCESDISTEAHGIMNFSQHSTRKLMSPSTLSNNSDPTADESPSRGLQSKDDEGSEMERCLQVLSFIPVVSTAIEEQDPLGMLRFQARVTVLIPILTACYTRHGGSARLAVEGLLKMLKQDFFASDVNLEQDSSSRITLLDVAIQVVCDVATMGTQETHMQLCVEFVECGVKYGCGHLNTRTVGYVLRFYLFVFYFGVSTPSTGSGTWGSMNGRDHFLLDDPRSRAMPYLPGGAPQSAVLSLKDLIAFSITRLQSLVASERIVFNFASPPNQRRMFPDIFNEMIDNLVNEVVDLSVHRVDIANYTQLAIHQIQRSGGSELFWYDMMNSCGKGLFGNDEALREETRHMYSMLFAILTNCVKVAMTKVRRDKNGEGIPRDVASKLMSLELLHFFLVKWDDSKHPMEVPNSSSCLTFIFAIRRLVVTGLLLNTAEAIADPRVYRRIIRIIGALWRSKTYRKHMKLEIGVLLDHYVVKILRLGPQILYKDKSKDSHDPSYVFAQQIELMKALQVWFSDPRSLLELYLNFDTDQDNSKLDGSSTQAVLSGMHWKIIQKICAALCNICEKSGEYIAQQIRESQAISSSSVQKSNETNDHDGVSSTTLARESAERLRKSALDAVESLLQNLAEAAAATKGPKFRILVDSWGSRSANSLLDLPQTSSDSTEESDDGSDDRRNQLQGQRSGILGYWQKEIVNQEKKVAAAKARFVQAEVKRIDHLSIAFEISREKGLRKGIDYLIACSVLTPSPRDIASFLRLHRSDLDPIELGKYLGEAGSEASETEYWNLIRFNYIRAISFVGMTVEQGLRHLLTNGGFRLPGEAQQVDRLITTFSQCYWEDNAGDQIMCPFKDKDTVFLLSFAIIMLNTDLHKSVPATTSGKNAIRKKMTKLEFTNNVKGVVNFNINDDLSPEYLGLIYESISFHPIVMNAEVENVDSKSDPTSDLNAALTALINNAKSSDALLRGLSTQEYKFTTLDEHSHRPAFDGDLSEATAFLARTMMSQIWHHYHGLINSALEIAHLDLKSMEFCATMLRYALSLTICLDMPMERTAFLAQLGRLRLFIAWRQNESDTLLSLSAEVASNDYKTEDWYTGIEEALAVDGTKSIATMDKNRLIALKLIDELVVDMTLNRSHNHVDDQGRQATREAVQCLVNADYLLNDPTRYFIRTGNLWKRSNRSGRLVKYRFLLFSDLLLYAKTIPHSSQFKIHEELPLLLMKVVDWFPPEQKKEAKKGFQIYHPRKSFLVFCANRDERSSWVSTLRCAIDKEVSRKVAMEGARKAAAKSH